MDFSNAFFTLPPTVIWCWGAMGGSPGFRYAASGLRLDFFFPNLWALDMAWCVATGAYLLALNKKM
jgi:hypothetical protein